MNPRGAISPEKFVEMQPRGWEHAQECTNIEGVLPPDRNLHPLDWATTIRASDLGEELRLYMECIYGGTLNRELPFGRNGISLTALLEAPDLTVRHTDLKCWMRQHYPEQRPGFLFSRGERITHPFISLETGQAMLVERQALKSVLEQTKRQLRELQDKHDALLKQPTVIPACAQCPISDRAEATYLNIVGGLLELMLGQSPSGTPYSSFKTQEAVVSALVAHHSGAMGIAERTLNGKFATARRRLRSASR